jgi:hypothetical protein
MEVRALISRCMQVEVRACSVQKLTTMLLTMCHRKTARGCHPYNMHPSHCYYPRRSISIDRHFYSARFLTACALMKLMVRRQGCQALLCTISSQAPN